MTYQRLFGDDRGEPVQVQTFKNNQSNHRGLSVLIGRMRCSFWVHQTNGCPWPYISFKSNHWSIIHSGDRIIHLFTTELIISWKNNDERQCLASETCNYVFRNSIVTHLSMISYLPSIVNFTSKLFLLTKMYITWPLWQKKLEFFMLSLCSYETKSWDIKV